MMLQIFLQLALQGQWTNAADWVNHITFWLNNMRSINDGSFDSNNINNLIYYK